MSLSSLHALLDFVTVFIPPNVSTRKYGECCGGDHRFRQETLPLTNGLLDEAVVGAVFDMCYWLGDYGSPNPTYSLTAWRALARARGCGARSSPLESDGIVAWNKTIGRER
jgi:hypothetical protein